MRVTVRIDDANRPLRLLAVPSAERAVHMAAHEASSVAEPGDSVNRRGGNKACDSSLGFQVPQHNQTGIETN